MFQNLINKDYMVNFLEYSNCYAFEIPNFLDDDQYNALYRNIPNLKKNDAEKLNDKFNDYDSQFKLKAHINELDQKSYEKFIKNNPILNEFAQIFKNPVMNKFFLKKFYSKILKSRFYDPKNFLKLLLRKNRTVNHKQERFIDKLIYNDFYTTFEIAYMFNGAESFPHTDGMKKMMSLLLYFPDENISYEKKKNLGTTFYKSEEFNLNGLGKNAVNTFEDSKNFKLRNKIDGTTPFEKKSLYGFIKSHKSWHSVEPFNIHDNFIRRNFNINILLV